MMSLLYSLQSYEKFYYICSKQLSDMEKQEICNRIVADKEDNEMS
jgi:hypothetical protein